MVGDRTCYHIDNHEEGKGTEQSDHRTTACKNKLSVQLISSLLLCWQRTTSRRRTPPCCYIFNPCWQQWSCHWYQLYAWLLKRHSEDTANLSIRAGVLFDERNRRLSSPLVTLSFAGQLSLPNNNQPSCVLYIWQRMYTTTLHQFWCGSAGVQLIWKRNAMDKEK